MLSSSSSSTSHSVNDYGRYKRTRKSPQVAEVLTTLQPARTVDENPFYSLIIWCNILQRTQNQKQKSGPLTGLSMKYSDFYRRSCALLRNTLLPSHCQELSI